MLVGLYLRWCHLVLEDSEGTRWYHDRPRQSKLLVNVNIHQHSQWIFRFLYVVVMVFAMWFYIICAHCSAGRLLRINSSKLAKSIECLGSNIDPVGTLPVRNCAPTKGTRGKGLFQRTALAIGDNHE
jgi:quinol-cytochrome oxidoreductase complex cytochrome b subunit